MYLKPGRSYYKGSEQHSSRGEFLILASKGSQTLYACVRKVALHQCGHWMMGRANVGGKWLGISGAYGHDGLPLDYDRLTERQREAFVEVPRQVADAYWHPEHQGWNSSGSEADIMRKWALGK